MTSLSALDKGGVGLRTGSVTRPGHPRQRGIEPLCSGALLCAGGFWVWEWCPSRLVEDHVFFFLFFRFQELDGRRFAHFLRLVLEEAHELVNLLVIEGIVG
jgi:hypothetical protein